VPVFYVLVERLRGVAEHLVEGPAGDSRGLDAGRGLALREKKMKAAILAALQISCSHSDSARGRHGRIGD